MKLCVEPESNSIVNSYAVQVMQCYIVSWARIPVIADKEIMGISGSNGVGEGAAATSSGASFGSSTM